MAGQPQRVGGGRLCKGRDRGGHVGWGDSLQGVLAGRWFGGSQLRGELLVGLLLELFEHVEDAGDELADALAGQG